MNNVNLLSNRITLFYANEVLSDPVKRKKYDKYGKDWQHAEQFESSRTQSGGDFSDFFESMFGGSAHKQTSFL